MCYIPYDIYNDICNLRSHMRTLIHDPTDNEISFTKKFQSFKNFRNNYTFYMLQDNVSLLLKKKKMGKLFIVIIF